VKAEVFNSEMGGCCGKNKSAIFEKAQARKCLAYVTNSTIGEDREEWIEKKAP
jgi:hypothetical protein